MVLTWRTADRILHQSAVPKTPNIALAKWEQKMLAWPKTWAGMPEELRLGEELVAAMRPFVEHLLLSGLAEATARRHIDNLWLLGGHVVRNASLYDELHKPGDEFLEEAAGPFDGPLISDLSKAEQRSLDSTCRRLYNFRHPKT